MKKYYYALDAFNRFVEIYEITPENEKPLSYYLSGEFEEMDVEKIIFSETAFIDGKIMYVGELEEEKKSRDIINLTGELSEIIN
jgi:hypothetical protein